MLTDFLVLDWLPPADGFALAAGGDAGFFATFLTGDAFARFAWTDLTFLAGTALRACTFFAGFAADFIGFFAGADFPVAFLTAFAGTLRFAADLDAGLRDTAARVDVLVDFAVLPALGLFLTIPLAYLVTRRSRVIA